MEASMRGSSRKSSETAKSDLIWDIGIFVLPVLMVIALIGLATTNQVASNWVNWISEGVQAEFAGSYLVPDVAPTQAEPAREIQEVGLVDVCLSCGREISACGGPLRSMSECPGENVGGAGHRKRLCWLFIAPCSYWAVSQFWSVIRDQILTVK
jgi:hypothetical protein